MILTRVGTKPQTMARFCQDHRVWAVKQTGTVGVAWGRPQPGESPCSMLGTLADPGGMSSLPPYSVHAAGFVQRRHPRGGTIAERAALLGDTLGDAVLVGRAAAALHGLDVLPPGVAQAAWPLQVVVAPGVTPPRLLVETFPVGAVGSPIRWDPVTPAGGLLGPHPAARPGTCRPPGAVMVNMGEAPADPFTGGRRFRRHQRCGPSISRPSLGSVGRVSGCSAAAGGRFADVEIAWGLGHGTRFLRSYVRCCWTVYGWWGECSTHLL